jgi:hypothetical protein
MRYVSNADRALNSTLRSMRRDRIKRERESLSPAEIDERITQAIIDSVMARGTVQMSDLLRTNIPKDAVTKARFDRCFEAAREREPAITCVEAFA